MAPKAKVLKITSRIRAPEIASKSGVTMVLEAPLELEVSDIEEFPPKDIQFEIQESVLEKIWTKYHSLKNLS